ncbi:MAG: hypothetical protein K9L02_03050 [Acholeplasmataceae bacterium]|nr:hypothetical protein [Acholeplasmataceae bacterium]
MGKVEDFQDINQSTSGVYWYKNIKRNDLTEEFIMENHMKLRSYTQGVYKTKSEFILRQDTLPYISISQKDYENFEVSFEVVDAIKWDAIEEPWEKYFTYYPSKKAFQEGKLIFVCDRHIYVKGKILQKKGFKSSIVNGNSVFTVTNPLKLYKVKQTKLSEVEVLNLDEVLKNNDLYNEEKRSEKFTCWLREKAYIK